MVTIVMEHGGPQWTPHSLLSWLSSRFQLSSTPYNICVIKQPLSCLLTRNGHSVTLCDTGTSNNLPWQKLKAGLESRENIETIGKFRKEKTFSQTIYFVFGRNHFICLSLELLDGR